MLKAKFIKSAVWSEDFPQSQRPEIAMVGRSNAGKSSLINAMIGPVKIAKVSATPGKTRLLNFFEVGDHYSLVDLPGYGFAKGGKKDYEMWNQMISQYFERRSQLIGIILICDVRRQWSADEQMVLDLCQRSGVKLTCVLNKTDKLSKVEKDKQLLRWCETSGLANNFFHLVSALKNMGVKEFEDFIFKNWVKGK